MRPRRRWAVEGGPPLWPVPLPYGQQALPPRDLLDAELRALFERHWYTNQGPLARRLEGELAQRLGVRHALCVTNETIAALMAAEALARPGLRVGISALAPPHVVQALIWAGWRPQLLDVDLISGLVPDAAWSGTGIEAAVDVDPFGSGRALPPTLRERSAAGMPVLADRSRGSAWPLPAATGIATVLSLHADQVLSALEGGCIALDDDALAARLRNIRSSYGAGSAVEVVKTSNGRMSEAQALIALLNADTLSARLERNRARTRRLRSRLSGLPGLRWLGGECEQADAQQWVFQVDAAAFGMNATRLRALLRAEGVSARGHAGPAANRRLLGAQADHCPQATRLAADWLHLPHPAGLRDEDVDSITRTLWDAHADAPWLVGAWET